MNGQAVMAWCKANIIIVICCIVILGALIAGPIVSNGFNEEIKDDVKKQLKKVKDIDRAGRAKFSWPDDPAGKQALITKDHVKAYQEVADQIAAQSDALTEVAIKANQGDQAVVMPELFPTPADRQRDLEVLPPELYSRISAGYDQILATLSAGTPIPQDEVLKKLIAKRVDFLDRNLRLKENEQLDESQQEAVREYLSAERLSMYVDHASGIGVYLSRDTLEPPTYLSTDRPSLDEMFQWQWRLWVLERIAGVVKEVNGSDNAILAPIHAIDQLDIRGLMETVTPVASERDMLAVKGAGGAGKGQAGGQGVPRAGTTDATVSITGRITNEMHDVVMVDLDLVVSLDRVDAVLDAFDRPGVMTVVDLAMQQLDVVSRLKEGYYFGDAAVVRLVLTVETLWLRDWTAAFMPNEVRVKLGLPELDDSQEQEAGRR